MAVKCAKYGKQLDDSFAMHMRLNLKDKEKVEKEERRMCKLFKKNEVREGEMSEHFPYFYRYSIWDVMMEKMKSEMRENDKITEIQVAVTFMQVVQDLKTLMEILSDREIPVRRIMEEFESIDRSYNEFITTAKRFLRNYRGRVM